VTAGAHHFGQKGVNGGISVFLCSNLGNGPAGTPACPPGEGTIAGTMAAANILGRAARACRPGSSTPSRARIRAGIAYVNVHSSTFAAGEIRARSTTTTTDPARETPRRSPPLVAPSDEDQRIPPHRWPCSGPRALRSALQSTEP